MIVIYSLYIEIKIIKWLFKIKSPKVIINLNGDEAKLQNKSNNANSL